MRPYSIDFRTKIIEIYQAEKISIRQLAQRFGVATSFVQKIIKQYKETGDLRPKRPGGNPPRKLTDDQIVILAEIIDAHNDATLEELCDLLEEKIGIRISRATMGRLTSLLNYSWKKKLFMPPKKTGKMCK